MSVSQTYHTFLHQIRQLELEARVTQLRTLACFLTGMFEKGSVHLSHIAKKMPGLAQQTSKVERLRRWLKNKHIHPRRWYEPLARRFLSNAASSQKRLVLLVDGTKVSSRHRLLMVALAYRRRALPVAWTWVRDQRGLSSAWKQNALLSYVHQLVPADIPVVVVGDSEFAATQVKKRLESWSWHYVFRHRAHHQVATSAAPDIWRRLDDWLTQAGQRLWLTDMRLTASHAHPANLLLRWNRGEDRPWLLASNLDDPLLIYRLYKRRMWIEELFGDLKQHGFDIEHTRLRHVMRLSRLTLAAALLYVWVIAFGTKGIKNGQRKLVDRTDRRDLSVFRIGYDLLERYFLNELAVSCPLVPYFETVR